jgi:hypothetical protein
MEEEYLLDGKKYTASQLADYAKRSKVSLNEYISLSGAKKAPRQAQYIIDGKTYNESEVKEYAKRSKVSFDEYVELAGVKKKGLSSGTGQPSQEASSTRTDRTRSLSGTGRPQGQKASGGSDGDITTKIKNITQKVTDLEEEEAVALLSKEFKGQGFTFEETGVGDAMIVRNRAGETVEIDLDPFFSDTEREEALKLRKFLSSSKSKEYTEEGAKLFSKPSLTKQEQKRFSNLRSKSKELDLITNQEFDYVDDKESYRDEAKRQVDSEIKGEGIWNTVKQTAKGAWNAYLESPIGEAISDAFGDEGKRTMSFLKADKTLLDKKIREVKSDPKNSELSNEEVREKAYELAIDDRSDKIRQSATTEYISSLPEDQKKSLELDKILELSSIDESAKEKVSKIKILQKSIELDLDDLKEAVAKYGENSNEANSIRNKAKIKIDDIKNLEASVYSDQEKIGTLEDEVNLLKRNYDGVEGFNAKYTSTVMDMAAGLIEFSGSFTPENTVAETTSEFVSSKIKQKADELRGMYRMPLESVESVSDFVDYASDVLANQTPNVILMTLTGTASLPVLGATSAGQKRLEMRSEIESGDQKYSKAQMIFVPMLYGAAEAIPEMNTLNMIRKASRAFNALKADDIARRSLIKSYSKRFIDAGFDNAKDLLKEEGAELFTNTAQNSFDKYILGKENVSVFDNVEDVIKDTAMFSLMLQGASHVFGAVSKPFSKPEYTEVLKNNASKLIEIEKQLNDPSISESAKKALKFSADKINSQSESIVDNVLSQMESMPIEQREVIVSIDKKQAELKATAASVIKDKTIESADKKIILKELKSEFAKIEDERIKILSGEYDSSSETIQQLKEAKTVTAQDRAKAKSDENVAAIKQLDDDEQILFTVQSLDEIPEQFRDRAVKKEGTPVEVRETILGLPLGKKTTKIINKGYTYTLTGKEAKDYADDNKNLDEYYSIHKEYYDFDKKLGEDLRNEKITADEYNKTREKEKEKLKSKLKELKDRIGENNYEIASKTAKVDWYERWIPEQKKELEELENKKNPTSADLDKIKSYKKTIKSWEESLKKLNEELKVLRSQKTQPTTKAAEQVTQEEVNPLIDVESTATALGNLDIPWFNDFQSNFGEDYKTVNDVSEAYHKAKKDGSNPELVKAVEELLTPKSTKQAAKETESKNSLSLFQEISDITSKPKMQEFSKQNPDVAFIHNNIEGIIKGIDGAKVVEC